MSNLCHAVSISLLLALLTTNAGYAKGRELANKLDYWSIIAPVVEGDYSGDCEITGSEKLVPASYVVAPDGKIAAAGQRGDFRVVKAMSITAIKDPNYTFTSAAVTMEDGSASIKSELISKNTWRTNASVLRDAVRIRCHSRKNMARLAPVKPHLLFEPFLSSRNTSVNCVGPLGELPKKVRYGYSGGKLTVGPHVIPLRNIPAETLHFEENYTNPAYSVSIAGASSDVIVDFDNYGNIVNLEYPTQDGNKESCKVAPLSAP